MTVAPHSDVFAGTIAQIVPVLLLAGVAVPLRLGAARSSRPRALVDLVVTGLLVGAAALTEFAALFGVWQGGLSEHDRRLLGLLLACTGLIATIRVITPLVRAYADGTGVPERRVWVLLSITGIAAFWGLLFLLN